MTETLGQKWRRLVTEQNQNKEAAEMEAKRKRQEEDGPFMILQIPLLFEQAFAEGKDYIVILPSDSVLCDSDVACRDVNTFIGVCRSAGDLFNSADLDGRARTIFDWCVANDLVVSVRGVNTFNWTLIAKAK